MLVDYNYLEMNKVGRPGRSFELFVGKLLNVLRFKDVMHTGADGTSEHGADYTAIRDTELLPSHIESVKWGIQAKCVESPQKLKEKIKNQLGTAINTRCLKHLLLVLATDPSDTLRNEMKNWATSRHAILHIWGKYELDNFVAQNRELHEWLYGTPSSPDLIEVSYFDYLYHLGPNWAYAIRLVGADDENFPPEVIEVVLENTPYELPSDLEDKRKEVIAKLKKEAELRNQMFHDGDNIRLIKYWATTKDGMEKKHLKLTLGPVKWYDFSVVDHVLRDSPIGKSIQHMKKYIDLDRIASSGTIQDSKLTNIVGTATTVITSDVFALYSERSGRVSTSAGKLTSCVAENINQEFDLSLKEPAADKLPVPFRTVIRGIKEELSPELAKCVKPSSIYLLGLSFDLEAYHPDFLFLVVLPIPYQNVQEICRQYPGPDFIEGRVKAVRPYRSDLELHTLLSDPNWIPDGKASLIRAIEFLDALESESGLTRNEVVASLANGDIPSEKQAM